ncbi:amino acid ABC transporter substrate-binding protein [Rubrivivax albus]|uniref:Branched-chain amino acid ABC transporter substrate-binding protein n=1 Tax=Rubrivivax albus TaxID=2499835 RepID=A0A3S2TNI4_9BURK|nr:amino acid ABC transporter substrate-binding protein [Rubrivivax albus]RVT52359.1 branched-chain amino acid ABC transporter substrate-binding protein [Rubrivivax albus]
MQRRTTLALAAAAALAVSLPAAAQQTIKIGAVAPKTGPLAGGAAVTQWPSIKMWVTQVNERGGLKMKDGSMRKIELVEYDDRTNPGETIKAVERLATQDKADFIIAPYGTGLNLAAAPVFAKYGYPQIAVSAITDKGPELTKRYPTLFLTLGSTTAFANSVADILKKLVDEGKIGKKVAMVNVADAFGIELAEAARPIFKQHGLELVFDKSYPLGTQDLAPVMKGAKAANPDAFVAWSYPPDTFALAELAKIEGLNVKAYYSAVATCFPAFGAKYGKSAEHVLGAGGINPDAPEMKGYFETHKKITGVDADYWAGPVTYASLQVLEQAIEGTGGVDKAAVTDYIKKNSFKTVLGDWTFKNQIIENYWTVGQWQGGKFVGVASTGKPGERPVQLKTGW